MHKPAAAALAACLLLAAACQAAPVPVTPAPTPAPTPPAELPSCAPEEEGFDSAALAALTEAIRLHKAPLFSCLISRRGRLVYELYTSGLTRDHAHYQMSVTKSVLSALIGIAIERGLIPSADAPVSSLVPRHWFASEGDAQRFRGVSLRHLMAMSGVDAPDPPRDNSPDAVARGAAFYAAPNRAAFALAQPLLARPGVDCQYNDSTPALVAGILQHAAGTGALEFAQQALFGPLGVRNADWMHQDPAGIDMGGYGIRLRPVDMQRIGILYLNGGRWGAQQLVPQEWVSQSLTPWIKSDPAQPVADYGWYWWGFIQNNVVTAHSANGWRGQCIVIVPAQELVITLTACIEDGTEVAVANELIGGYVFPALRGARIAANPTAAAALLAANEAVRRGPTRIREGIEARMVPSVEAKERRIPYRP